MIGDTYYYPTPLEEYDDAEIESIAKQRMDEYIEQNYREGGVKSYTPLDSASVKGRMERIAYCRSLWNNDIDERRYDFLYNKFDKKVTDQDGIDQVITMEMPAKVRHIPIVRPKLQALVSKQMGRPLVTKVIAVDKDSIDKKLTAKKDDFLRKQLQKIAQKNAAISAQQGLLQQQAQMIQQMQMQGQQGQQPDPQMQQLAMQMQAEIEVLQVIINKESVLTKEEIKTISEYYNYTYKEFEEDLCSKALHSFIDQHRLRQMSNDIFEEQMITGEPVWYVNWEPGLEEPEVRHVKPENIWYQYNESAKYLHELDWCVEYMPLSIGQVIQMFGSDLTKDQLEEIRSLNPQYSQDAFYRTNLTNFPDGSPASSWENYDYLYAHEVDVYKVYWKEQTEVYALYSKNEHDSPYFSEKPPFVKFLTSKEAEEMQNTDAKKQRLKRKGQVIKKAYRVDLWSGIRISDRVYLKIGKCDFQYRISNRLSDVPLPYVGFANNRYHQAYSPLWETKDIQELYNILHYQEELLIALSGVKGTVVDLSQMPTGMTMQEVLYYKKHGVLPIETVYPNGKPKRTSFNQFQNYDDSVSQGIAMINQIKMSLVEMVGEITGITRQQTGQILHTDQVGTTQMALEQSNVVTEYYFQKDEELFEIVLTRLTNIFPYAYEKGKKGIYVLGKERQEILNIINGQLKGEFRTIVNSGSKEREILQQAKQIGMMKFQQEKITASQYIDMLNTDTMFEIQKKLREYEEETLARMERMAQQNNEQQKQAQMELKQMDMQMQQQMAQMNAQVQAQMIQLQGQIDLQKEQLKQQTNVAAQQLDAQLKGQELEVKKYGIDKEAQIEEAYLNFQYTELDINAQTQRAQMLINKAKTQIEISKSRSKEKVKD